MLTTVNLKIAYNFVLRCYWCSLKEEVIWTQRGLDYQNVFLTRWRCIHFYIVKTHFVALKHKPLGEFKHNIIRGGHDVCDTSHCSSLYGKWIGWSFVFILKWKHSWREIGDIIK